MRRVVSVSPLGGRKLSIRFADGIEGVFDMTPYLRSAFFKRLEDDEYFRTVRLFFGGIGWPEGQDLGPDTIAADLTPA
jgi:hypothetical protein